MSGGELRRFDSLERVVHDTRRELESLKSTALARLGTHTHPPGDAPTTGLGSVSRAYCSLDTTVNNNATTYSSITGMDVPLESNASYMVDGWLVWESPSTADIKFRFSPGLTGLWSAFGPANNQEPIVGGPRINYIDTGVVGLAFALSLTGDTQIGGVYASAALRGFVETGVIDEGSFGLQFAQDTATAVNTTVKRGSWIRWTRVA